ncbi:hypothetical protein LTR70_009007 [Exophiala xenobiotica]|uniref:Uncharacterized protein n=1 Tax=Lithohypha guttulata TaxID=1690604 RepID=A0ABR0JYY1_9EURO|nr:hypothetical protein LTR24_008775 [Lithohypha guttulata]KAK5311113.1 hypothetical protein LTR70_009007 [Exophiala xenobiotica]
MSQSKKPHVTNNKELEQTDRRNPLLRGDVLESFMLNLFKDEIQEIEGLPRITKTPSSTDISTKNDTSSDELSETIKLRRAYYDFDREEAEREGEARRDALEAEVYNSPEVQKRLKHLVPKHDQDTAQDKLVRSLERLKLEKGFD